MSGALETIQDGIVFFLREFIGQIISAIIILAGLTAWFYFSTVYAAILVVIAGLLLWGIVGKLFQRKKRGSEQG